MKISRNYLGVALLAVTMLVTSCSDTPTAPPPAPEAQLQAEPFTDAELLDLLGQLLPKRIAYVNNRLTILYLLQSVDNIFTRKVTGRVDHFSEYALAW